MRARSARPDARGCLADASGSSGAALPAPRPYPVFETSTRVRAHEPMTGAADDQAAVRPAHDLGRLAQDELHLARVLPPLAPPTRGPALRGSTEARSTTRPSALDTIFWVTTTTSSSVRPMPAAPSAAAMSAPGRPPPTTSGCPRGRAAARSRGEAAGHPRREIRGRVHVEGQPRSLDDDRPGAASRRGVPVGGEAVRPELERDDVRWRQRQSIRPRPAASGAIATAGRCAPSTASSSAVTSSAVSSGRSP